MRKTAVVCSALFVLFFLNPVYAKVVPDLKSPNLIINLPSRTIDLRTGNTLIKRYSIAIGKPSTPTPTGNFIITHKDVNPWWYPPRTQKAVPPGPDNPLGYRWMEFLPAYGIHGTNAPWSIGGVVSNGCVRMKEEEVEELFEVVPVGTPVRIIYERVRVEDDGQGTVSVGVYPDVYGYQQVKPSDIQSMLKKYGLSGFISEQLLNCLIRDEADKQIVIARLGTIKVNNKTLIERAVFLNDKVFVPVLAVAGAVNVNAAWDERSQHVRTPQRAIMGTVKDNIIYSYAEEVPVLLGGRQRWDNESNSLQIEILRLFLNDKQISTDVVVVNDIPAVPAFTLCHALGLKASWDNNTGVLTVEGNKVPVTIIKKQPYIKITHIYEYFKAYVYWNESEYNVELTFPFQVKGGND